MKFDAVYYEQAILITLWAGSSGRNTGTCRGFPLRAIIPSGKCRKNPMTSSDT